MAILKDMGINDFEPRVINQMLEFSYRFAVCLSRHLSFLMIPFEICHWHPGRCQGLLQPRQKESSGHRGRQTSSPACCGAGRFLEISRFKIFIFLFQGFTSPPPREALLELARAKNATQLPLIQVQSIALYRLSQFFLQPKAGIRLPPDRHCLTATNYKLKARYFKTPR